MTIFFDMTETGLSNLDMEYTKYLIGLCKNYYPHFLNYILIFEMPWVLDGKIREIDLFKFINYLTSNFIQFLQSI